MRYENKNKKVISGKKNDSLVVRNSKALIEYLVNNPKSVKKIYVKASRMDDFMEIVSSNNVDLDIKKVNKISDQDPDRQWVEAEIDMLYLTDKEFFESEESMSAKNIVVLDHLNDPRNFGAIARSCAFFGVKNIVIAKKRQVPVTQVVLDTAQGAFAHVNVVLVSNIGRIIDELKKKDYWVCGTSLSGQPLSSSKLDFDKKVIVMGAEETGLSALVEKKCDVNFKISGTECGIESLNVSVALGIFLYAANGEARS